MAWKPSRMQDDLDRFELVMSKALSAFLREKARILGMTRAELIRRQLAASLGRKELAEMPRAVGQKTEQSGKTRNEGPSLRNRKKQP